MNKVWMCSGSTYTQVGSGYKVSESLPVGIQEYESRDNLSCSSCIFYDGGLCEKGLLMTDDCPEYWD